MQTQKTEISSLSEKDKQDISALIQAWRADVEGCIGKQVAPWEHYNFKCGEVAAAYAPDRNKAILFVSSGSETGDVALANLSGIVNPLFGLGESWFRRYASEGFIVGRDASTDTL